MAVSNIKALIPGELQKVWDLVLDIEIMELGEAI